jgi:hypothetical protein
MSKTKLGLLDLDIGPQIDFHQRAHLADSPTNASTHVGAKPKQMQAVSTTRLFPQSGLPSESPGNAPTCQTQVAILMEPPPAWLLHQDSS